MMDNDSSGLSTSSFAKMFLVNFIDHSYQFHWRPEIMSCAKCAEIYRQNREIIFRFLREFLISKDISLVFEEGGTCLNIAETLRAHGNQKTIAQEAIASISDRSLDHLFVDITTQEAEDLIERGIISNIAQLRNQKRDLRDSYIAKAFLRKLPQNQNGNALLLCADGHFAGVKRHLEEAGIEVMSESIADCDWYLSNDEIDRLHFHNHQDESSSG